MDQYLIFPEEIKDKSLNRIIEETKIKIAKNDIFLEIKGQNRKEILKKILEGQKIVIKTPALEFLSENILREICQKYPDIQKFINNSVSSNKVICFLIG